QVERLILVDALGVGPPRRVLAYRILLTKGLGELTLSGTARALRRMNPATIRRFWGWYLNRPGRVDSIWSNQRIADHGALLSRPEYRAAYLAALRSIAGMRSLRNGVVVEARLPELRMPTLLVWGRHDHIFPASHAEAALKRLPNGRVEIFEESGHTPQMEEPERFNQLVLDFLSSGDARGERRSRPATGPNPHILWAATPGNPTGCGKLLDRLHPTAYDVGRSPPHPTEVHRWLDPPKRRQPSDPT